MKGVEAAAPSAPPLAAAGVGRALFTRAVSADNADDVAGGTGGGGGETKGEDPQPPPPHPSASFAAVPVKTLPRPVYDGDKRALINLCAYGGSGDVDEARDLIARGIDIDEQDNRGNTALMGATWNKHLEIAQELIRAGAALDLQDRYGRTALTNAATYNNLETVQELIRAGAALDVQNDSGRTALQITRENGHTKIATLLREAGARCPGYERSGWFDSTCQRCGGSKAGRWHEQASQANTPQNT